jgi:MoxR-like ATPase|nr:MAG: ATPase AAA [Bacteroidota bacterium]
MSVEPNRHAHDDVAQAEALHEAYNRLRQAIGRVIVGQEAIIEQLLISLLARGHCLLIGVPGLAKTLLVRTVARVLDLKFSRIQFTPDLMPSDITGTEIIEEDVHSGRRYFKFVQGPIFANIVLADEINRTPPKTQAALLEAMQEYRVTVAGQTYTLEEPFFVLATQNPIEQEGTYPLPEAQLDRFMFNLWLDYPTFEQEVEVVRLTTADREVELEPVLNAEQILAFQRLVRRVPVAEHVIAYAVRMARRTRPGQPEAPDFVRTWVSWGAGPRASQYLILGAKARALLAGRLTPEVEDVRSVAVAVLRHRIVTNFNAEADGIRPEHIVERLLALD